MCPNIFFIRNSHNDNNTIIPYKVVVLNSLPYNRLKCALKIHHFNPPDTCSCVRVSKAEQWYQQSDPEHKDDFTGGQSCIRLSITLFMFSWYNINQLIFLQGILAKTEFTPCNSWNNKRRYETILCIIIILNSCFNTIVRLNRLYLTFFVKI